MDSTPTHTLTPITPSSSIKASTSKLPIKRKTPPDDSFYSPVILTGAANYDDGDSRHPPPFKFHRIWTEPEEIRFLRCLLDCSSEGLSFPKDLNAVYARFSASMSQPYTKSQLSEKLRRLRKKFRVISSRLAKGVDIANLSLHDSSLYQLSKRLWHPDTSNQITKQVNCNLMGVEVSFSPTLPSVSVSNQTAETRELNDTSRRSFCVVDEDDQKGSLDLHGNKDVPLSEVNVKFENAVRGEKIMFSNSADVGIGEIPGKIVVDVFEHSLKEVKMNLFREGLLTADKESISDGSSWVGKMESFEKRWRDQKIAELDILARRLRLVLERSVLRQ